MEGFELVDGKFIARVADEAGLDIPFVLGPIFDNGDTAWQLLEAARPFVFQSSSYSARGFKVAMLRKMVMYMRAKGTINIPQTAEEWQTAIVDIYQYHLKEQPGKSRFTTRIEEWQNSIKLLLKHLRDVAHLIPEQVSIPPKQRFRTQTSHFNRETVASCVFRTNVTGRFGMVTGDFGNVTDDFGNVTGRTGRKDRRCA